MFHNGGETVALYTRDRSVAVAARSLQFITCKCLYIPTYMCYTYALPYHIPLWSREHTVPSNNSSGWGVGNGGGVGVGDRVGTSERTFGKRKLKEENY